MLAIPTISGRCHLVDRRRRDAFQFPIADPAQEEIDKNEMENYYNYFILSLFWDLQEIAVLIRYVEVMANGIIRLKPMNWPTSL